MSITAKNLSFQYESGTPFSINALQDINFTIQKGEFVGIMGHTGCGKSTLFQLLCGLLTPTDGTVFIDGNDLFEHSYSRKKHRQDNKKSLRKKIGIVFQYPENQLFETTVEKDVSYGLKHMNISVSEMEHRVQWALEQMGFCYETIRYLSPLSLSGGEKRRVAIAGILAICPDYLLLDEPIAGLDPVMRMDFMNLLQKLNHQEKMTILMISHNADCICDYTKRILILEKGHLIADDTTRHLFSDMDWITAHQLDTSQSRLIASELQKQGLNIPKDVITYKELLCSLQNILQKNRD